MIGIGIKLQNKVFEKSKRTYNSKRIRNEDAVLRLMLTLRLWLVGLRVTGETTERNAVDVDAEKGYVMN